MNHPASGLRAPQVRVPQGQTCAYTSRWRLNSWPIGVAQTWSQQERVALQRYQLRKDGHVVLLSPHNCGARERCCCATVHHARAASVVSGSRIHAPPETLMELL